MFNRVFEWRRFSNIVERHVVDYTVAQYGDSPNDPVTGWTPEMCMKALEKYVKRFSSNQRGPAETIRDTLKIAHFACILYFKLLSQYDIVVDERKFTGADNPLVHGGAKDDSK